MGRRYPYAGRGGDSSDLISCDLLLFLTLTQYTKNHSMPFWCAAIFFAKVACAEGGAENVTPANGK